MAGVPLAPPSVKRGGFLEKIGKGSSKTLSHYRLKAEA
jgi:hypothetical protein